MATPNSNARQRFTRAATSLLGRYTGPELFYSGTVDLSTAPTVMVPRNLNLNRPLESILIFLKFRVAVTVANYTAVSPETPQNILQKIILTGTHRNFGAQTPINMTGATAFAWNALTESKGNDCVVNNAQAAPPGRPMATAAALTTAGSPYDVILCYRVPLGPLMGNGQSLKRQAQNFLYMPQDWNDTLQLQLQFGDKTAFGDPTGATVTFSAYGSGAGSPSYEIHLNYSLLGQMAGFVRGGLVVRSEQALAGFTAIAPAGTRLAGLQKQITTQVLVKAGVLDTHQTAGVRTFASLDDDAMTQTRIVVDNKPVRNNANNYVMKAHLGQQFHTTIPQGYTLVSFVDGQNPRLAYRGDGVAGGSSFELQSDIAKADANRGMSFVQEYILGGPFPALRP